MQTSARLPRGAGAGHPTAADAGSAPLPLAPDGSGRLLARSWTQTRTPAS